MALNESHLYKCIAVLVSGALLNAVISELVTAVVALEDISVTDAECLHSLLTLIEQVRWSQPLLTDNFAQKSFGCSRINSAESLYAENKLWAEKS